MLVAFILTENQRWDLLLSNQTQLIVGLKLKSLCLPAPVHLYYATHH